MKVRVRKAVEGAAKSFNESLRIYWCAYRGKNKTAMPKDNDVSERNVSFHFCSELMMQNFKIYAEVGHNRRAGVLGRLDYLAIDSKTDTMLAIEAKRIHGLASIRSVLEDVSRVHEFDIQFASDYHTGKKAKSKYGLVIGITWNKKIMEQWENLLDPACVWHRKEWAGLSKKLIALDSEIDAIEVGKNEIPEYDQGWILYAVFKVR